MNYKITHRHGSEDKTVTAKFWAPTKRVAEAVADNYLSQLKQASRDGGMVFDIFDYELKEY